MHCGFHVVGVDYVFHALCSGRELSINLQCQTNDESTSVLGNLTHVKQRGAVAGYGISEEVTGVRPCAGFLICSLLKSERRFEDGVLVRARPWIFEFSGVRARTDRPQWRLRTQCVSKNRFAIRTEGNHKVCTNLCVQPR